MFDTLQERLEKLAGKYIDLVEKKIDGALERGECIDFAEINEGIRMLNHISCALHKLSTCKESSQVLNR